MPINIAYESGEFVEAIVIRLILHRRLDKLYRYSSNPNIKYDV